MATRATRTPAVSVLIADRGLSAESTLSPATLTTCPRMPEFCQFAPAVLVNLGCTATAVSVLKQSVNFSLGCHTIRRNLSSPRSDNTTRMSRRASHGYAWRLSTLGFDRAAADCSDRFSTWGVGILDSDGFRARRRDCNRWGDVVCGWLLQQLLLSHRLHRAHALAALVRPVEVRD